MQRFLLRQPAAGKIGMGDASTVGSAFLELMTKMMSDPVAVANAQIGLFNEEACGRACIFLMQESLVEPRGTRGSSIQTGQRTRCSAHLAKATSSPRSRFVFGTRRQGARSCDRAKGGFLQRQFVDGMSPSNSHRHQSGSADDDPADRRSEPSARSRESARRPRQRRGPSVHHHDRHEVVPARRKTSRRRRERSSIRTS